MGHIPQRQCMLCRKKIIKSDLLRFVNDGGNIKIDEKQKENGRGAYICSDCRMSDMILKKRVLDKAFRQKVPDEIYDLLKGDI